MATVHFNCPLCFGVFQVAQEMLGSQVACPHCKGHVSIPRASSGAEPLAAPSPPTSPLTPPPEPPAAPPQPPPAPPPRRQLHGPPVVTHPSNSQKPDEPVIQQRYPPGFEPQAPTKGSDSAISDPQPAMRPGQPTSVGPPSQEDKNPPRQQPGGVARNPPNPSAEADALLPPTSDQQRKTVSQPNPPADVQSLLPPEIEDAVSGGPEDLVEIPPQLGQQELSPSAPSTPDNATLSADHIGVELNLREPTKTIGYGKSARRVRILSTEEKARRRLRKNIVAGVISAVVLGGALIWLVLRS